MRIGVVSDTHNHRANVARIVELFNEARVTRVIHTGDITTADTLELLARLEMPLYGVYGNNDVDRDGRIARGVRFDAAERDRDDAREQGHACREASSRGSGAHVSPAARSGA